MANEPDLIEEIAAAVRAELSQDIPKAAVTRAVGEVIASREAPPTGGSPGPTGRASSAPTRAGLPRRAVLTASGLNRPGVLAKLCEVLARRGADIHDVSQSLAGEYFHMIIVFDLDSIAARGHTFLSVKQELEVAARSLGSMHIVVMREDVLRSMHRI